MNDEIKEILDYISDSVIKKEKWNKVKDYITNLQQENERLKQPKIFIDTQDMEERYGEELYKEYLEKQVKDYKSRIEKATEYMNNTFDITSIKDMFDIMNKLEDILNGRSDE